MGEIIRRILMVFFLFVFLGSAGYLLYVRHQYQEIDRNNSKIAETFTEAPSKIGETIQDPETGETLECAPIVVDFDSLKAVNSEVTGWLYCEGTEINYPVMQGTDNDLYLHHLYDKSYSYGGSIFVEADNRPDFGDVNTIIYGHNMKNGSMFGTLPRWADQAYYEAHPVLWFLTPGQDYKIVLFSGYNTSADSDTYTIFSEGGDLFRDYLLKCQGQSLFQTDVELSGEERCVLLSTCAYMFDNARFVLHGVLEKAGSAGGVPISENSRQE